MKIVRLSGKGSRRVKRFVTYATTFAGVKARVPFRRVSSSVRARVAGRGEEEGEGVGHLARSRLKLKPCNTRFAIPLPAACQSVTEYVTAGLHFRAALPTRRKKAKRVLTCARVKRERERASARRGLTPAAAREQTDNIRSSRDSLKTASGERSLSRFCRRLIRPSILSARCA